MKTSPAIMRQAVFDRDHGVCAICRADTMAGDIRMQSRRHIARGTSERWQADHIVPVVEGGGECAIDGYRATIRKAAKPHQQGYLEFA
jgi:5-methylcytosine-specific restriction endonuclease McrA